MNTTFQVECSDWKDEGINADRETFISKNEYTLAYQVMWYTISYSAIRER